MSWMRFRVGTASESINQSNIPLQVKLLLKVVAMAMSLYLSGMFEFSPVSSNPIHTLTSSLQLDSEGTKKSTSKACWSFLQNPEEDMSGMYIYSK